MSTVEAAKEIGLHVTYLRKIAEGKRCKGVLNGYAVQGVVKKIGRDWIWPTDLVEKIKKARGER